MPAAPDNKYAAKPANQRVNAAITIRGTIAERHAWKGAHAGQQMSWNDWCRQALNRAALQGVELTTKA